MEFTEVQELNNITLHARSFIPGQFFPAPSSAFTSYGAPPTQSLLSVPMFDYEKLLEDTPPGSPSQGLTFQKPETLKLLSKETEETVEDLLINIKNSLLEFGGIDEMSEESPKLKQQEKQISLNLPEESSPTSKIDEAETRADSNLQFEKINEDFVSKSYLETKNLKSFLSSSIKAYPMEQDYSKMKRGEIKTFKVYFLTEKHSTLLPINTGSSVAEVIKQCLDVFKTNKAIGEDLLKYPERPDAYQLQKDMINGPLDRQKSLKELRIARELILVESKGFDASMPYDESKTAHNGKQIDSNTLIAITIYLPTDERTRVTLQMGPERQLKDVFSRLALEGKAGYSSQNHNFRLYSSDPETRWKEAKNFLDINIPIKNIKPHDQDIIQVEIVKKKFADEPSEPLQDHRSSSPLRKSGTVDLTGEPEDDIILYNEVSANHYEEFEVTKINENGRKQERILGIDGFKLYNYSRSYKQDQNGRIGEMFTNFFFSKFGTLNPERLLTDVVEAKIIAYKIFKLGVLSEGRMKWICYETADNKTAKQIVAKLNYLKGIQEKKNI